MNSKGGVKGKSQEQRHRGSISSRPCSAKEEGCTISPDPDTHGVDSVERQACKIVSNYRGITACGIPSENSSLESATEQSRTLLSPKSSIETKQSSARNCRRIKPPVPQFSNVDKNAVSESSVPAVHEGVTCPTTHIFPQSRPAVMYPYYFTPFLVPYPAVFGQVQSQLPNGTTVVYTSSPIPMNTSSILLIPAAPPAGCIPPVTGPMSPTQTVTASSSSVSSDPASLDKRLVVFIERNSFKPWFESNLPSIMQQLPVRLKRYKSVETFMHWLNSRKKYESLELNVLIRVTEINRLLSEVKSVRNLKVFAYQHLFDRSESPLKSTRAITLETDTFRKDFDHQQRLVLSNCLEEACGKLVAFEQSPMPPN
jgi:hypothetical protein